MANRLGFNRFAELPVRIERRFGSTISLRAVAGILSDTFSIWWRLRVTRRYAGPPERASESSEHPVPERGSQVGL